MQNGQNGANPQPRVMAGSGLSYAYPLLIRNILRTGVEQGKGRSIVYRDQGRYDYATFGARVARLANALTALGLRAGQIVGVLDWDSHRYLESYFAVPGMGAILHTVNIRLSPDQILYTINHAQDDLLLVHADFLPMLEGIWDQIDCVKKIILIRDDDGHVETRLPIDGEYEAIVNAARDDYEFPDFDENACATLFYTTGTTGLPKGVFFSHRQIVLHTLSTAIALGSAARQGRVHRDDVYMPITPMFHVHAWGMPFIATMLGLTQVYPGRYTAPVLLDLIRREKVTFSHCVPTLLTMLLNDPAGRSVDLSRWKVVVGGSALSRGLATVALERGIDAFAGYGMSETCPVLSIAHIASDAPEGDPEEPLNLRTRAGFAIPLVEMKIVDAAMQEQPQDGKSSGEIIVRAPWLTPGYLGDPEHSDQLWRGGYLHTGDVGIRHPDGSLQITDRIKDVIKTGGEWISSLELESLISQVAGVQEVAVIGIPDPCWGERPMALSVPAPAAARGVEEAVSEHMAACCRRGAISKWAIPQTIVLVDNIAKTSVGKIDKKAIRARYGPVQAMAPASRRE